MTCGTTSLTVGAASNSGTGGTCISSPHVVQYPEVPKRDDGKWMALGSIIGGMIGKFANGAKMGEASAAEGIWKDLNTRLKSQGQSEYARVPALRALAKAADENIALFAERNWGRENLEFTYAEKLKPCDDALHEKLCETASCGYTPDYIGIATRAKADAASLFAAKRADLWAESRRYNSCRTQAMCTDLAAAEIIATVSATNAMREAERQTAWKYNWETVKEATTIVETNRLNRAKTALEYDIRATTAEEGRYNSHTHDADASLKQGLDMLTSAGQNYAWLAESLRRSAEKDTGNFSSLGALILPLLYSWEIIGKKECE